MNSISQYEHRFQLWGFVRNLKKFQWLIIANKLRDREHQGISSAVYVHGHLLDHSKLRKEISRKRGGANLNEAEERQLEQGRLPPFVEIRSPESHAEVGRTTTQEAAIVSDDVTVPVLVPQYLVFDEQETSPGPNLSMTLHEGLSLTNNQLVTLHNNSIDFDEILVNQRGSHPDTMTLIAHSPTWENHMTAWDHMFRAKVLKKLCLSVPSDTLALPALEHIALVSRSVGRDASLPWLAINTAVERALLTIVPARHSSNLANMAQGASLLYIAMTELVNSKLPRVVSTS